MKKILLIANVSLSILLGAANCQNPLPALVDVSSTQTISNKVIDSSNTVSFSLQSGTALYALSSPGTNYTAGSGILISGSTISTTGTSNWSLGAPWSGITGAPAFITASGSAATSGTSAYATNSIPAITVTGTDITALRAATTSATASGINAVYLPPGIYNTGTNTWATSGLTHIYGAGSGCSSILGMDASKAVNRTNYPAWQFPTIITGAGINNNPVVRGGGRNQYFSDFGVIGTGASGSNTIGFEIDGGYSAGTDTNFFGVKNVLVAGFNYDFHNNGSCDGAFEDCAFVGTDYAYWAKTIPGGNVVPGLNTDSSTFKNSSFGGGMTLTGTGFTAMTFAGTTLGNTIQSCNFNWVRTVANLSSNGGVLVSFKDVDCEQITGQVFIVNESNQLDVNNCNLMNCGIPVRWILTNSTYPTWANGGDVRLQGLSITGTRNPFIGGVYQLMEVSAARTPSMAPAGMPIITYSGTDFATATGTATYQPYATVAQGVKADNAVALSGGTAAGQNFVLETGSGTVQIGNGSGLRAMYLTGSNGNLGVGTATPGGYMDRCIEVSAASSSGLTAENTGGTAGKWTMASVGDFKILDDLNARYDLIISKATGDVAVTTGNLKITAGALVGATGTATIPSGNGTIQYTSDTGTNSQTVFSASAPVFQGSNITAPNASGSGSTNIPSIGITDGRYLKTNGTANYVNYLGTTIISSNTDARTATTVTDDSQLAGVSCTPGLYKIDYQLLMQNTGTAGYKIYVYCGGLVNNGGGSYGYFTTEAGGISPAAWNQLNQSTVRTAPSSTSPGVFTGSVIMQTNSTSTIGIQWSAYQATGTTSRMPNSIIIVKRLTVP